MAPLLVIYGDSLGHRAYHAMPEVEGAGGRPVGLLVGFANALLGAVTQYQESDGHPSAHGLFYNIEWFAQDNWKVKRNVTIDAGMRFYSIQPTQSASSSASW